MERSRLVSSTPTRPRATLTPCEADPPHLQLLCSYSAAESREACHPRPQARHRSTSEEDEGYSQ